MLPDDEFPDLHSHPISLLASSDPDTLYLGEALRATDRVHFLKVMEDEVRQHTERGHWIIVRQDQVPEGVIVIPSVWSMR